MSEQRSTSPRKNAENTKSDGEVEKKTYRSSYTARIKNRPHLYFPSAFLVFFCGDDSHFALRIPHSDVRFHNQEN